MSSVNKLDSMARQVQAKKKKAWQSGLIIDTKVTMWNICYRSGNEQKINVCRNDVHTEYAASFISDGK